MLRMMRGNVLVMGCGAPPSPPAAAFCGNLNKYAGVLQCQPVELFQRTGETRGSESSPIKANLPEVFEGRVDVKAAAVHISDIGSRQFHIGDG